MPHKVKVLVKPDAAEIERLLAARALSWVDLGRLARLSPSTRSKLRLSKPVIPAVLRKVAAVLRVKPGRLVVTADDPAEGTAGDEALVGLAGEAFHE